MNDKTRNWTCIIYPESAVDNWREILDEFHFEWFESPVHNSDVKEDGTPKKEHIHLVFCFSGVKSYEQVKALTEKIGATIPQRVEQLRAMVRYLAHLDHPKKAQYDINEVVSHNGADLQSVLKARGSDKYKMLKEIFEFCRINELTEYTDLIEYAITMHEEWLPIITEKHCFAITKYMDSLRNQKYTKKIEKFV